MAVIKAYSDLEKSKKLAEILPLESADMFWRYNPNIHTYDDIPKILVVNNWDDDYNKDIPCWSLASLLEQLPYEVCDDDGNSVYLQMNKEDDVYQLVYEDPHGDFENIETDRHEHFVDACVSMILKLNDFNVL